MWNPDGSGRHPPVDLSTQSSSSSSSLLSGIRAQREAREALRRQEHAAVAIQRVWRGRQSAAHTQTELLDYLEGGTASVQQGGRALLLLLKSPGERIRTGNVLEQWCAAAIQVDGSGNPAFAALLAQPGGTHLLALLVARILRFVSGSPGTHTGASLLNSLETLLRPNAYSSLLPEARSEFVGTLALHDWVQTCVAMVKDVVAATPPKKKNPLLQPIIRLVTAPLAIVPASPQSPFVAPLLQHLLTVPSLPSVIPLPSLTHLSSALPFFAVLLPAAAQDPSLMQQGPLSTELGKTYFLANLATFGITGGMLARSGVAGAIAWMRVVGALLDSLREGWGAWAERSIGGARAVATTAAAALVTDSEDDEPSREVTRVTREPLPANVASKLMLLASPNHISALVTEITGPRGGNHLGTFAQFILGTLSAFRGSPRWELTLDGLLTGTRGRALVKQLWREGARGKWPSTPDGWTAFAQNPNKPLLLLLSQVYCHYLLITPDDEFFDPKSNPLTVDEVLDLSSIWRDLAFWGYMNGVSHAQDRGVGTEEQRQLFTRGVTRVSERNGRRRFARDEFWVMDKAMDLDRNFIEAVQYEDDELEQGAMSETPRWGPRHITRRQIASVSPRLGLLNNLPMSVPFQTRLLVFRQFVRADRERLGITRYGRSTRHRVTIRRDHLAEDGFRQINSLGSHLKGTLEITFVDQWGNEEPGIDGGGLFKEFLHDLSKEAFDAERGLWLANANNELYPNTHSYATESHQLAWYGFIGRLLGKALYADILVDVKFAGFFLAKWLGRQSYLDDLASLDKDLYRGLIQLKNYPDPEELSLNFTIAEDEFGVTRSVDLVPGGSDIAVTAANRHEYIHLVCKYKLDRQFALQSQAFFAGLSDVIDPRWLRMFDQNELAQLLGGEETPIDIQDLRANTSMSGFEGSSTPQMFWNVVNSFTQQERRDLLRFVTSCSRPPLLGFKHLNPPFGVRNSGTDKDRLPTASACANLLKLPDYQDERVLRAKLLQSITSGAGFDMS